jgi:hypothetical protein
MPGSAERTEEWHIGFIQSLAAGDLPDRTASGSSNRNRVRAQAVHVLADLLAFPNIRAHAIKQTTTPAHRYSELARRGLHRGCDPEIVLPLPGDLAATQRDQIDGVTCEMPLSAWSGWRRATSAAWRSRVRRPSWTRKS